MSAERTIAVALHDVEPATFDRCALIRDWLHDHGIDHVTLLVVPAADLHPFFQRRPDLAAWLLDCRDRGDAIAQHGFQHRGHGATGLLRRHGGEAEFARMDAEATHACLDAGRRMLTLAGVEPRGFVAPAYAYTPALRRELAAGFDWWATLLRLVGRERASMAPALSLRRSPLGVRAGALASGRLLRLDLHPADFDRPRHVLALEAVLRASRRTPVTYDDLC
jgi:predicted deacetylase